MGVIGDWIRGRPIGRGSSATVTIATASASGETFAVKSVDISRSAILQKEQRVLLSLNDSPSIISCFGSDVTLEDSLHVYNLFLEYAPGGSIADEVNKNGHLDEETIRSRTREILTGLSFLHSRGFAHCDIKSDNVLIGSDGRAKIADLGCARLVGDCLDTQVRGSPAFMAPEAARGEEQGPPADVWALGCTIIEMATGKPAWPGMSDPMSLLHHVAFSDDTPELPKWVSGDCHDFLERCFERDPDERWSVDQLLKHPFTNGTSKPTDSPKSTLDQWLSGQDDDDEDSFVQSQSISPTDRIRQLDCSSHLPSWCWDEDWVPIRNRPVQVVLLSADMTTEINDPSSINIATSDSAEDMIEYHLTFNCSPMDDDHHDVDDDGDIGIPASSTKKACKSPRLLFYCNMCSSVPCKTLDSVKSGVQLPPIGLFICLLNYKIS